MLCGFLLVVELMLLVLAALAVAFRTFFLTEALELDEMVYHFQHTKDLATAHLYTAVWLLLSAGAVEALRQSMRSQDSRARVAVPDADTDYSVVSAETPREPASASAVSKAEPNRAAHTHFDARDTDGSLYVADAAVTHPSLCYVPLSVAFIVLAIVLVCVFLCTGIVWSYPFWNWEHGTVEQLKRTWNNIARDSSQTQSQCTFIETHHCSGGVALCDYPNVVLPDVQPPADSDNACPPCDFTGRHTPLNVHGTCASLIVRRTHSDTILFASISVMGALLLVLVCAWLIVKQVRAYCCHGAGTSE